MTYTLVIHWTDDAWRRSELYEESFEPDYFETVDDSSESMELMCERPTQEREDRKACPK